MDTALTESGRIPHDILSNEEVMAWTETRDRLGPKRLINFAEMRTRAILDAILTASYCSTAGQFDDSLAPTAMHNATQVVSDRGIRTRRRSSSGDPLKKVSLRLHDSVAVAVKKLVDAGEAPSADAFIEAAVVESLRKRRQEVVYASYARAAADPGFMADMHATMSEFDATLMDGRKTG